MNDMEFTRRFERGEVRNEDFRHREHLRVAWTYLRETNSEADACDRMREAIRAFARAAGHPGKYHETMTLFWVRLVAEARRRHPDELELAEILPANPHLLDKSTPFAYYSSARLMSDDARLTWHAPDLKPLCSHATAADSCDPSRDAPGGPLSGRVARERAFSG
jgi:hypothetical protein